MRRLAGILLVLVIAGLVLPAVASACPLCADAKSDADYAGGSASLPHGFYYSILFMVVAPFAVAGGFVFRIVVARRRARAREAGQAASREPGVGGLVPESSGAQP